MGTGTGDILGFHPKPRQEPEVPALPISLSLRDKETLKNLFLSRFAKQNEAGVQGL